jgi:hypothetical protein
MKLTVLWQTEGGAELETDLHRYFKARRSHGEWFDFAGDHPVELVQDVIARGLHRPAPRPRRPARQDDETFPLNVGDRVAITWPRRSGPPYGMVRAIKTCRNVATYRIGGPLKAQEMAYAFDRLELRFASDPPGDDELIRIWEDFTGELAWLQEHF